MINKSVGFIGSGRVTRILLGGWKRAGKLPQRIVVSDPNIDVLHTLKQQFPEITMTPNDNAQPAACDLVFAALHPPVLKDALAPLAGALKPEAIVISLTPKIPIAALTTILGGFQRIVRMNPNAPSIVNKGFNPVIFSPAIPAAEKAELLEFFEILGQCPEIQEEQLEAYAMITAMGPTYLWFQLYELLELAQSFGLSAQDAQTGIAAMVNGAVAAMFEAGLTPAQVMDLIPVKPLGEDETTIKDMYQTKLNALFKKLKS
ncbi:NADP oxidoreductase coenzyme F420-dependent [Candidatus Vecturithrix granuli]|uniref:NADP oxidoreductase coenzyme F420-dependent n=1 Tax=Vecturithrix granuli TaxID=1499967 RepID=A0A081BWE3_VECG1|nr:NADP oxidoreductase coenzyme F420-dependent [Candidatus Vecturithrix granuli]